MTANCKNCGAAFSSWEFDCPYCGTVREQLVQIMVGKPIRISFMHEGREISCCVNVTNTHIEANVDGCELGDFADDLVYKPVKHVSYDIGISGKLVPFEEGGLKDILYYVNEGERAHSDNGRSVR